MLARLPGTSCARLPAEGLPSRALTEDAVELLSQQTWRGNVRELKNLVFRAALLAREDTIDAAAIASLLEAAAPAETDGNADFESALRTWLVEDRPADGTLYHSALAAFERPLFEHALRRTGGNQLRAARMLGINRNTLRKRLSELGIEPEKFSTAD